MEEPQNVDTVENRGLSEKKHKRILKTPNQVAALEKFYNEHKYPTEAMKLELAESIGLTEKQVSGWFCHRRLKDKKFPNEELQIHGKQDRSSGVIQDRDSGLRQDSCGSIKQGENKHYDPREVESRRFTTERLLPTEPGFDDGSQYNNNMDDDDDDDDDDDTSSGSSSPLKDNFHPQNLDHVGTLASKYPTHIDVKNVKARIGPSGYLKVKGLVENAAVTAVKRQLGRHYRDDGPPLEIEFESLPPGAFENLVKAPVCQSYYVGEPTAFHLLPNEGKVYEGYNPKSYHPPDLDDSGLKRGHISKHYEKHSNSQYKQIPPFSKHSQSPSGRIIQMGVDDDSASVNEFREQFESRIKHTPGVRRPDSLSYDHPISYRKIIDVKEGYTKVNNRDRIVPMTYDLTATPSEFVESEDRGRPRKTFKDVKFNGDKRRIDEYSKLVSVKIHPGNEMRITKNRDEFSHQVYPRKEAMVDFPPKTNMTKRSSTASFSDDGTASSGD